MEDILRFKKGDLVVLKPNITNNRSLYYIEDSYQEIGFLNIVVIEGLRYDERDYTLVTSIFREENEQSYLE